LHVAGADVVDDGVAVNVVEGFIGGDAIASATDDEGKLSFVVRLGGVDGEDNRIAWADDGGGQLHEDDRSFWEGEAGFEGVVTIVEADEEDSGWIEERGVEADFAERVGGVIAADIDRGESGGDGGEGVGVAGGAKIDDLVGFLEKRARTDSAVGCGEGYEFHGASRI
jgi:hypothetical protein